MSAAITEEKRTAISDAATKMFARNTEVRNSRQLSIVSAEEMAEAVIPGERNGAVRGKGRAAFELPVGAAVGRLDLLARGGEFRVHPLACNAHGGDEGLRLGPREHQWRQIEAPAQSIADAGFALDRHALALQVGHVPVDRAHRNLEPPREQGRRGQTPPTDDLHDLEQAIRAAHRGAQSSSAAVSAPIAVAIVRMSSSLT